ncbi:DNA primase isoform X2 [Tasmannia lanceolata]|uniref:DNA primase isoform X2 n=1 Tax=Tasmannia lanceolata TaxID=3420 RepID=UPI004064796F
MSSDPVDDVDRLFDCFKCGVSTPQSAVEERKTRRVKLRKAAMSTGESSTVANFLSPASAKHWKNNSANEQLHMEKHGTSTIKTIRLKSGKQISPVVFYGSPHGVPVKRPSHLLRLLREIHVDRSEQNDLNLRNEVWATFPKQDQAMRFATTHSQVHVFSYQDHLNGQRRFLVSTYTEFWQRYKNMDPKFRHHYEVIQEGFPCHLYFDLEFSKRVNAEKNGDEMVDLLISLIFYAILDKYSIQGDQEWIIELDSSTEEKFSRHLIIRIPETAFKDNLHVGAFVAEVCSRISSGRGNDPRLDKLYVLKDSSSTEFPCQLFLDTAVYSRNRCFRLALSSKAGKSSVLIPTGRFKCKNMSEQHMFMESLICRMDVDCKKLLICKMDLDCKKTLCFDSEVNGNYEEDFIDSREIVRHAFTSDFPGTYCTGRSPFPAVDVFVESIASIGNVSVMYIVDFRRAGYYQKCYDPDCKGYRSPLRPIPRDAIPDYMSAFNWTRTGNYSEALNINFNLQLDENVGRISFDKDELITDSCKKDRGWWLEAIEIADGIENMRKVPEPYKLDDESFDEDYEWWVDVEKTASLVEEQSGKQIVNQ